MCFEGVSKSFRLRGGRPGQRWLRAVKSFGVAVGAGEILGLVGESGAGKSTVGRLALGLERPDRGRVVFEDEDLSILPERRLRVVRHRMHMIFQDPYQSLHPGMRVRDVVAEPLAIGGVERDQWADRVADAMKEVQLTPVGGFINRFPHELSGGQRQRVALARAIAAQPRFVVADEPASMLDVSLKAGILELLGRMRDRHAVGLFFITHDLVIARHICDRIGVMQEGELVEIGSTEEITVQPQHPYTQMLLRTVNSREFPQGRE